MSAQAVDFYFVDQLNQPVAGVLVKIFNSDGTEYYVETLSEEGGVASFLLEEGEYQARYYKRKTHLPKPQRFSVTDGLNSFDVPITTVVPPTTTDPRFCVASGYFRKANGAPAAGVSLVFVAKWSPMLLDGDGLLNEKISVVTDQNGFASVGLVRCGQYELTVEGVEDVSVVASVPDLPQCNLPDLVFPTVASVSLSPEGPYELSVGETLILTPVVYDSVGNLLDGAAMLALRWGSSDTNVLAVSSSSTEVRLYAVAAGEAEVQADRLSSVVRIPNTPILGLPVQVTIS